MWKRRIIIVPNNKQLRQITIPASLTKKITNISKNTFTAHNGNTGLTSITIADNDKEMQKYYMDQNWFQYTELISQKHDSVLIIPDTMTRIADYQFANSTWLTKIIIPKSVTSIGEGAFFNCYSLSEIVFENEKDEGPDLIIHNKAFANCYGLYQFSLPRRLSLTSGLRENVFQNCYKLVEIIDKYNYFKFKNNQNLTSRGQQLFDVANNPTTAHGAIARFLPDASHIITDLAQSYLVYNDIDQLTYYTGSLRCYQNLMHSTGQTYNVEYITPEDIFVNDTTISVIREKYHPGET